MDPDKCTDETTKPVVIARPDSRNKALQLELGFWLKSTGMHTHGHDYGCSEYMENKSDIVIPPFICRGSHRASLIGRIQTLNESCDSTMSETVVYADQPRGGDVDSERDGTEDTSASAMSEEERSESIARRQDRSESVQVKSLGPEELSKLGISHRNEYDRFGRIDDIDKAIEYHVCAVDLTTHGDPELAERLSELGVCYGRRYGRLGKVEDIEGALECAVRAVELTAESDPELARRLAILGISHGERYRRLGEAADLDRSLEHDSRALALTPDGHPDLPRRHASLGVSY
ncbi:unnamed protein product, partial [Rhizoctonia solani]